MSMTRRFIPFSRLRCQSGLALIEFAITAPILILMLLGIIEFARYAIIHQKLDKAAHSMADFVTQNVSLTQQNLTTYASAIPQIMKPFDFDGSVTFSSVFVYGTSHPPCTVNVPCVTWQFSRLGGAGSHIGHNNGDAVLPGNYPLAAGQNVIVAEVFFNYEPLLAGTSNIIPALVPHEIYKVAVYKPRQGTLENF